MLCSERETGTIPGLNVDYIAASEQETFRPLGGAQNIQRRHDLVRLIFLSVSRDVLIYAQI